MQIFKTQRTLFPHLQVGYSYYPCLALNGMTFNPTINFQMEELLGMTSLITIFFLIMWFETLTSTRWVFGVG